MRTILHTTIRCCFATHSFIITLQSHISSGLSFCTLQNLLGYFFRNFYTLTCVRHFFEIIVDNRQIHPFAKSTTIRPSSFLVPVPYLPITSAFPMFPSPTCPNVHLGQHLEISLPVFIHFLSTHPVLAKIYFSPPCCCQPVEHTRLLCSVLTLLPPVLWPLVCLTPSSPPRNFQTAPSSPISLSHFFFYHLHRTTVCHRLQCSSLYSLSTLFPLGIVHLFTFAPSCLPALSPFPSLLLHLRYPRL